MSSAHVAFELSLEPNPRMVSVVRRFVEEAFERATMDPDLIFRVAMTSHELLENASKYAVGGAATLRASLQPQESGLRIEVALTNETTSAHIERLRDRIGVLRGSKDPVRQYQALMRLNLEARDESGLGLARIRAEGEMNLELQVQDETVTIVASADVGRTR
jgi:two-component sensor histidine kinase